MLSFVKVKRISPFGEIISLLQGKRLGILERILGNDRIWKQKTVEVWIARGVSHHIVQGNYPGTSNIIRKG